MSNTSIVTSQCNQTKFISHENSAKVLNRENSTTVEYTVVGSLSISNDVRNSPINIISDHAISIDAESDMSIYVGFKTLICQNKGAIYLPASCVVKKDYKFKSKKFTENSVLVSDNNSKIIREQKLAFVHDNRKRTFKPIISYDSISVENKPVNTYEVDEVFTVCNEVNQYNRVGSIIEPISVIVDDYKPPSIGNSGSGEGIRFIRLSAQKYSYTEIFLDFNERKTVDVIGLPDGLHLENGVIKGSPKLSGKFPLTITLDNNSILDSLLIVPELPRLI